MRLCLGSDIWQARQARNLHQFHLVVKDFVPRIEATLQPCRTWYVVGSSNCVAAQHVDSHCMLQTAVQSLLTVRACQNHEMHVQGFTSCSTARA